MELALLFPVLLLILMGVMDLGRVFNAYITITNATREGARYGASYPDDLSGINTRVINEAEGSGVTLSPSNISISAPVASAGTPITVTVNYTSTLVTLALTGTPAVPVQSSVTMMIIGG